MRIHCKPRDILRTLLPLATLATCLWMAATPAHELGHDEHDAGHAAATGADAPLTAASTDVRELVSAFRRTGDDRYLDRAWAMLEPGLQTNTPDSERLVQAAAVAQSRHDFDTALALLDRALSFARNDDQAWLLTASVHLVRGNAEQADRACGELRYVPLLVAATCHARVSIARGDGERALRRLAALLESPAVNALTPEWLAWSLSVAGDAARAVDPTLTAAYYERSLQTLESAQVRAALVDVLLESDRLDEAVSVLDAGSEALPLDVRRMIVAKRRGDDSAARRIAATDHEFRHWIADEDWLHAREMARFYLDVLERPALAARLADINLGLQREPEDLLLAQRTRSL